jgi:hypothetical protein
LLFTVNTNLNSGESNIFAKGEGRINARTIETPRINTSSILFPFQELAFLRVNHQKIIMSIN